MASSRWKRFAFFERQSITIPDAVMNDLQIVDTTTAVVHPNNRPLLSSNKSIPLDFVITTAALPLHTKPTSAAASVKSNPTSTASGSTSAQPPPQQQHSVAAMWSSLSACHPTTIDNSVTSDNKVVQLPSQGQASYTPSSSSPSTSVAATTTLLDGLVLSFASSPNTSRVHCFDVTVRCNPSQLSSSATEELDGWRGYWTPFTPTVVRRQQQQQPATTTGQPQQSNDVTSTGVVAIATCRVPTTKPHSHSPVHVVCIGLQNQLVLYEDPHLYLSCRLPVHDTTNSADTMVIYTVPTGSKWNTANDGDACVLNIVPGIVAVGTTTGVVVLYSYNPSTSVTVNTAVGIATKNKQISRMIRPYLRIPPPPVSDVCVVSVQLSIGSNSKKAHVYVSYNRATQTTSPTSVNTSNTTAGICCYDLPLPPSNLATLSSSSSSVPPQALAAPLSRHDLDGRHVGSSNLVDSYIRRQGGRILTVARPDGLYSYSHTERTGVAPIDGPKLVMCIIPPPTPAELVREVDLEQLGSGYSLVASTDEKSGRDVVDIYDSINKLVAFHLLLSPGHRALQAAGVTTLPTQLPDGSVRGGRSSAAVITSGGALVTFTEKLTEEKISLLVQKHLYPAAIVVAYADPSYEAADITSLYQQHAEHLYRKGDFSGAMDQYIYTIGSLESSHVIFRYLDAPKIPLLVKYLEQLRTRELATSVHNELLRTCYLKLNDVQAADSIAVSVSWSINDASLESLLSNLTSRPRDALATICSLEAHQTAEVLVIHGASLVRVLPRETAGVVISLCVGTYAPRNLADASMIETLSAAAATTTAAALDLKKMVNTNDNPKSVIIEPYPVQLFASAFVEHPKMLRLILAHCNRNKCPLTPPLRRTLLELTLAEWNQAKRSGDTEAEKLRHREAIASLTDSHSRDIGDYDALVIVQQAGFEEGELLLYERLQMTPVLLERYAMDGNEKARRQMLAMCQADPDILADVLGHLVEIASQKLSSNVIRGNTEVVDEETDEDESDEILDDIQEALTLARRQGVLPPVRIARILAGEGSGQFSSDAPIRDMKRTIPLSVALDYVGTVLEKSRRETSRLKSEIEEYNQMCNSMENEIASLLRVSFGLPPLSDDETTYDSRLNIDELFAKVKSEEGTPIADNISEQTREAFWREMNQSEDSFDTISHFFAKGSIG